MTCRVVPNGFVAEPHLPMTTLSRGSASCDTRPDASMSIRRCFDRPGCRWAHHPAAAAPRGEPGPGVAAELPGARRFTPLVRGAAVALEVSAVAFGSYPAL